MLKDLFTPRCGIPGKLRACTWRSFIRSGLFTGIFPKQASLRGNQCNIFSLLLFLRHSGEGRMRADQ